MSDPAPLSVSEFLERVNALLADQVAWVEGEVSDVRVSQGRFLHFDLKDDAALVHCFGMVFRVRVPLEDGMKVRVWGTPRVYQKYGKFSLNVEIVEPSGEGALRRAFELLKAKLETEGLFALERKRALPRFPERIGLITSPEAAAYSDVLKVLQARRGGMEILFVPVQVQGREAASQIAQAIDLLTEGHPTLDALVLVRGGGSLEELQAFNDERVVRALARSRIPTVVGVGHERDVTLADLVADVRGSTPSNAAELLTLTRAEIQAGLGDLVGRLRTAVADDLRAREERVGRAVAALRESVREAVEHVLTLSERMASVGRLIALAVHTSRGHVLQAAASLQAVFLQTLAARLEGVRTAERVLLTLHPERVLARGYSITRERAGRILTDARRVGPGTPLATTLHHGTLLSTADLITPWPRKHPSTSRGRTKSSNGSSPPSKQATLI